MNHSISHTSLGKVATSNHQSEPQLAEARGAAPKALASDSLTLGFRGMFKQHGAPKGPNAFQGGALTSNPSNTILKRYLDPLGWPPTLCSESEFA